MLFHFGGCTSQYLWPQRKVTAWRLKCAQKVGQIWRCCFSPCLASLLGTVIFMWIRAVVYIEQDSYRVALTWSSDYYSIQCMPLSLFLSVLLNESPANRAVLFLRARRSSQPQHYLNRLLYVTYSVWYHYPSISVGILPFGIASLGLNEEWDLDTLVHARTL